MKSFEDTIKIYLDEFASKDPQFAKKYKSKDKSVEECCRYILSIARKRGTTVVMSDEEVYGLAIHYYDETNIKVPSSLPACEIQSSKEETVKLSAKEKESLRAEAIREFKAQCIAQAQRAERERKEKRIAKLKQIEEAPGLFG